MRLTFPPWRRRLMSAFVVVIALAATVVVYGITPHDDDIAAPFAVRGAIGEPLSGRTLAATVTGVRLASSFDLSNSYARGAGPTTGTWVVVDADVEAVDEPTSLSRPTLTIGEKTYYASERFGIVTLGSVGMRAGIPSRGALVFEVADEVLHSSAARSAEIGLNSSFEAILDSKLVIEIDLTALPVEADVVLERPVDVIP